MTVKRMRFLQELLAFVGLDKRLHLEWISSAEAQKFVRVVTDFTEKIRELGPNPVKSLPTAYPFPGPRAVPTSGGGDASAAGKSVRAVKLPAQSA
jgi:F420-non-reducing hydrogenase iron-sulfur subunit